MSTSDSAPQPPVPPSSPSPAPTGTPQLSTGQMILLGSAVVLLIGSFLPWYHVSFMGVSGNASGWHQVGTFAWLLVIIGLVVEAARVFGMLPLDAAKGALASAGINALAALFVLIFIIVRISDGHVGFGFYVGIVGLIGLVYGLVGLVKSGDVMNTAKSLQNNG